MRKKGDGEVVCKDDLWKCLFGGKKGKDKDGDGKGDMRIQREVGRLARAEAAEGRAMAPAVTDRVGNDAVRN